MKVIATKVKIGELKPGDLFSTADQHKWAEAMPEERDICCLGVQVYIRTDDLCPESRAEEDVYRITIVLDETERA